MLRFKDKYDDYTLRVIKDRSRICIPHYTNFDLLIKDKQFVLTNSKKMDMKNKISMALVNNQVAKRCYAIYKITADQLPSHKKYLFMQHHMPTHLDSYVMRQAKHGRVGVRDIHLLSSLFGLYVYYVDRYHNFFSTISRKHNIQFSKNELFKRNKSEIKWLLNKCEDSI